VVEGDDGQMQVELMGANVGVQVFALKKVSGEEYKF
jgi:hypothetical protein